MKAFLLSAGEGTRLRPLTAEIPKCLVPIRGIPLLSIWLELCRRSGIDEVLINLHWKADRVREFLSTESSGIRVKLTYEETPLGSAGTLLANRDWILSERCFWVFYADVLTSADLARMMEFHRRCGQIATLGVCEVQDPARCGIVAADDRSIVREFVEKPSRPTSNLAFSGLLLGTPAMLDVVPNQFPADIGFHLLPRLVGHMAAYRIPEYLIDIGTPENYQSAQLNWPGLSLPAQETSKC